MHHIKHHFQNNLALYQTTFHFVMKIAAVGLLYLSSIIIANLLTPYDFGVYEFALNWVEVLMIFILFGSDRFIPRLIPRYLLKIDKQRIKGIIIFAFSLAIAMSLFVILIILLIVLITYYDSSTEVALTIESKLNIERSTTYLLWHTTLLAVPIMLLRVFLRLFQALLQGLFRPLFSQILETVAFFGLLFLFLLGLSLLTESEVSPYLIIAIYTLAVSLAVLTAVITFVRVLPFKLSNTDPIFESRNWIKISTPITIYTGLFVLTMRLPIILLGFLATPIEVGLVSIAIKVVAITELFQISADIVMSPRIAEWVSKGDYKQLQHAMRQIAKAMALIGFLSTGALIIFGETLLSLFGNSYQDAYSILVVLALGMLIRSCTGIPASVLLMAGFERDLMIWGIVSTMIGIFITAFAIQSFGLIGAAWAWTLIQAIGNVGLAYFTAHKTSIWTFPR